MAQKTCVLDTSIIVKLYTNENDSPQAIALLKQIHDENIIVFVPDLALYELANSLRWNKNFSERDVRDALTACIGLGFNVRIPTPPLFEKAISLAYHYNCTVYDAIFLALAKYQNTTLITADIKFTKKAVNEPILTLQTFLNK
ncbi:type II toxin-antitoxin system VapC family toxin [Candidatus Woesearchaeota archaeon]|nr:type II toxin-antitoxin system VapC family toxin [Candidatus Woesearchaeota archaeon]